MKILDTDILVGVLRRNEDAIRKYEEIEEDVFTTILNAQELLFGALISDNTDANLRASKALLGEIRSLSYDESGMIESVKIQAFLEKKGRHIGLLDEMIAGICIANNATVITRNTVHYSKIPNLKVEKW